VLTSTKNPQVVAAAALASSRERRERGEHLAEGPKIVLEALAHARVVEVFATAAHQGVLGAAEAAGARAHLVDERVLARIATTSTPQGVIAVVRTPDTNAPVPDGGLLLVLDGLADPGNVGTLVRTAAAFGVPVVVTGEAADPFGPKAVRASAGTCYVTEVRRRGDLADHVDELRGRGRRLVGLDAGAATELGTLAGAEDVVLVLGGEPRGLGSATRVRLDLTVAIPIAPDVESLNVAAAGAIALHAVVGGAAARRPRSLG
jgi:TrmH family RNA methyltransferase